MTGGVETGMTGEVDGGMPGKAEAIRSVAEIDQRIPGLNIASFDQISVNARFEPRVRF